MDDRLCWNCGHAFEHHLNIDGGCANVEAAGRCDCTGYEDAEYSGHQRKRDLYTVSDHRRRLSRRGGAAK